MKVLHQGLASYSNIARGRAYPVLSRGRLGRSDDSRALLARLAGVLSSEELGDVSAEDGIYAGLGDDVAVVAPVYSIWGPGSG